MTASLVAGTPSRNFPISVSAACASASSRGRAEEAAGALDGVDEPENVVEDLGVVRVLLETHEFDVDDVETFVGLGHEFPQQVVHDRQRLRRRAYGPSAALASGARPVCR